MKKIKYNIDYPSNALLTYGKVYDVIGYDQSKYNPLNWVIILDDSDRLISWLTDRFIDVTTEYRSEVIDDILK